MKTQLPKVSLIIPTFNEEKNISCCLSSIFRQNYPVSKLEVIVVDDKSTDRTKEIVKQYPVIFLTSGKRHGEISKMIGFKRATGEYAMYLDADNELVGEHWFQKMLKPLLEESGIIGSFTWEGARKDDSALERFLSFDPLQRDSIYQFFSPSIESVIESKKRDYSILKYEIGKIPPAGRCLYRRAEVMKFFEKFDMFLELDFLVLLAKNGYKHFAYVENAGLYHHHARSLKDLLKKRRYNLRKVYLARSQRLYPWFDLKAGRDVVKLGAWIIYANLIVPSIAIGLYKSIKERDWAGLYEPVVNLLVTDMLLIEFIKNSQGRKMLLNRNNE